MSARSSIKIFCMATVFERVAQILLGRKHTIQGRQGVLVTLNPSKKPSGMVEKKKATSIVSIEWKLLESKRGARRCTRISRFVDIYAVTWFSLSPKNKKKSHIVTTEGE